MAKYGKKTQKKMEDVMHEYKHGKLKSGGSGKKVKSRKQAVAIGLSEARKAGGKAPAAPKKSESSKKQSHKKKITKAKGSSSSRSHVKAGAAKKRTSHATAAKSHKSTAKKSSSRSTASRRRRHEPTMAESAMKTMKNIADTVVDAAEDALEFVGKEAKKATRLVKNAVS